MCSTVGCGYIRSFDDDPGIMTRNVASLSAGLILSARFQFPRSGDKTLSDGRARTGCVGPWPKSHIAVAVALHVCTHRHALFTISRDAQRWAPRRAALPRSTPSPLLAAGRLAPRATMRGAFIGAPLPHLGGCGGRAAALPRRGTAARPRVGVPVARRVWRAAAAPPPPGTNGTDPGAGADGGNGGADAAPAVGVSAEAVATAAAAAADRSLESRIKPSSYTAYATAAVDGVATPRKSRSAFAMSRRRASMGNSGSATADALRAAGVAGLTAIAAGLLQHEWVSTHLQLTLCAIVAIGYAGTVAETALDTSKTGLALLTSVGVWTATATAGTIRGGVNEVLAALGTQLAGTAELVVFLIASATVVELVAAHGGFRPLAAVVASGQRRSPTAAVVAVGTIAFGLAALADNLTATVVSLLLLRGCLMDRRMRWRLGAVAVVAANGGGAWSAIGDVTTTLLWSAGRLNPGPTAAALLLPSAVSVAVTLAVLAAPLRKGGGAADAAAASTPAAVAAAAPDALAANVSTPATVAAATAAAAAAGSGAQDFKATVTPAVVSLPGASATDLPPRARIVLGAGVASLLAVPAFVSYTGLPPFLGMTASAGGMWILTDLLHARRPGRTGLRANAAVARVDVSSLLFITGALLLVGGLDEAGLLSSAAAAVDAAGVPRLAAAVAAGALSSIMDNVPLVAAVSAAWGTSAPPDDAAWHLLSLAAGTGASILPVGSVAGVALMALEGVPFGWYVRHVSAAAALGYLAGVGTFGLAALGGHAAALLAGGG